ncbi:unnamed protein product [Echinostoma caproni]|uniref:Diphthine--ammonia ligase n=1 Tax=Echinostoma caproni TaxID=27848 RepID=A0A183AYS3_9TREM|nr:unnamed protein product [Echinostoma caproni]
MDFVALVSGGKDSIFSMMDAISHGYQLKALIHLAPKGSESGTEERDSYMYQSVASEGVELLSRALNVPLIYRTITGKSVCQRMNYITQSEDEVEDLCYAVSEAIDRFPTIKFICSGAILSDYQRIRVEHVASRLGIGTLAFLWRRSQVSLLNEMVCSGLDAIIVKVASSGLEIKRHLGHHISDLQSQLVQLTGPPWYLNACGEGGEYETFTLDCPLFEQRIVQRSPAELVIHSDDESYPVAYLRLNNLALEVIHFCCTHPCPGPVSICIENRIICFVWAVRD